LPSLDAFITDKLRPTGSASTFTCNAPGEVSTRARLRSLSGTTTALSRPIAWSATKGWSK
jgi:hypothetical protein